MTDTATPAELLATWRKLNDERKAIVEREREAREAVIKAYFPVSDYGTNRAEAEGGSVKYVRKLEYSLDKEETAEAVEKIVNLGERGQLLAEKLIKWEPRLSVRDYKTLDKTNATDRKVKKLIDGVLTTKDGSPTLEFEPGK